MTYLAGWHLTFRASRDEPWATTEDLRRRHRQGGRDLSTPRTGVAYIVAQLKL